MHAQETHVPLERALWSRAMGVRRGDVSCSEIRQTPAQPCVRGLPDGPESASCICMSMAMSTCVRRPCMSAICCKGHRAPRSTCKNNCPSAACVPSYTRAVRVLMHRVLMYYHGDTHHEGTHRGSLCEDSTAPGHRGSLCEDMSVQQQSRARLQEGTAPHRRELLPAAPPCSSSPGTCPPLARAHLWQRNS